MNAASGALAAPTPDLPLSFARRHGVLLRRIEAGVAHVALRPDVSVTALNEVRRHLGLPLAFERVSAEHFDVLLREAYEAGSDARAAAGGLEETTDLSFLAQDLPEQADLLESEDDAPIIRLVLTLLSEAFRLRASDIHIEPLETTVRVRYRLDGKLVHVDSHGGGKEGLGC